jgi:protein phosphatase
VANAFEKLGTQGLPALYDAEDEGDYEPTRGGGAAVRRLLVDPDAIDDEPTGCHELFEMRCAGRTDVGRKRRSNEDAMLVLERHGIFAVADGMGGHAGGQIASRLAIEAIEATFTAGGSESCVLAHVPRRGAELVQSFAAANEAVRGVASKSAQLYEMGTTLVAARFCPAKGRLYVGHVGDSRCYRLRDGELMQITRDHTLAELGVTGREARHLSRAVGPSGIVEADLAVLEPHPGDIYVLCSDGLTKMLNEEVIADVLRNAPNPELAVTDLVELANAHGATDNVTAVIIEIRAASSPPPANG